MGIKSLILNNWKSYNGQTSIPIKQFAAIIGPNGCGKSNLLDAICFALGVNSAKLRGKKMQDQIHKLADGTSAKFASVEIIFEKSAEKDLILSGIVSFKRTVNALGNSSFEFENKTVSKKNYFEKVFSSNSVGANRDSEAQQEFSCFPGRHRFDRL
ncbi:hypothetical protein MHBO_000566 [Bonamia ostreae]|uniref:RecF/RecN/SMC N-terminal domain-containing protein n=1 Tax=Bonamia ostreae TaxID=126728 RepID=A0ABV2AGV0_9EUKA